jgi:hypothetical protein
VARGVDVSELFHDAGGVFHHAGQEGRISGPDTSRRSYASFASFADPDGNGWLLQEVTARLPGRSDGAAFSSPAELATALRRAAAAHAEHESRIGRHDVDWPAWYADFIVATQTGRPLPQ